LVFILLRRLATVRGGRVRLVIALSMGELEGTFWDSLLEAVRIARHHFRERHSGRVFCQPVSY